MPTILQWVRLLEEKIQQQTWYAAPYERRYRNEHVLPFIEREFREVYGSKVDALGSELQPPRVGMAGIGVDALVERMTVLGADSEDAAAAKRVDYAFKGNDLDVMQREAVREALVKRVSFAQIDRSADGRAVVGIEAAEQMAVHRMQHPPYDVDAALKVSVNEWTGQRTARLWLIGRTVDLLEADMAQHDPEGSNIVSRWTVVADVPSRLPVVPVVEFAHKARLLADPTSEIEPIASLCDIVDLIEGLMVFAGHFGAVPIRFGKGIELPKDKDGKPILDKDGRPMLGFNPRADHVWITTSKDAEFGQLTPAGLTSFVEWSDHAVSQIRSITKVASSYYRLDLKSHMSAELLKVDEAPMVRRIKSMGQYGSFGVAWRKLMQIILMIEDPASTALVQPRWGDPETRIESAAADGVQKLVASGMGVQTAAKKLLGWSEAEVSAAVAEYDAAEARKVERDALANDPIVSALTKQTSDGAASVGA